MAIPVSSPPPLSPAPPFSLLDYVSSGWIYNRGCSSFLPHGCYTWALHNTPVKTVLGSRLWTRLLGKSSPVFHTSNQTLHLEVDCPSLDAFRLLSFPWVCEWERGSGEKLLRHFNRIWWWAPVTPSLEGWGQRIQTQGQAGLRSETLSQTNKQETLSAILLAWNGTLPCHAEPQESCCQNVTAVVSLTVGCSFHF